MRRCHVFGFLLLFLAGLFALMLVDGARRRSAAKAGVEDAARLVRRLDLTDLCLSTEAGYTRNPSQADVFSPFQDHPSALEHFPSGSIIRPPKRAR